MTAENVASFVFAYFLTASILCVAACFGGRRPGWFVVLAAVSLIGLVGSVVVGSLVYEGRNFPLTLSRSLAALSRTDLAAVGLGTCCALPLVLLWREYRGRLIGPLSAATALVGILGTLLLGGVSAGKEYLSPYLPHPDTEFVGGEITGLSNDGFAVETLLETEIVPVRVAVSPSGRVYVSGQRGIAAQEGAVVELVREDGGGWSERLVAPMLNRPYGLIALDDRLYVSRSGQYAKFDKGVAEEFATGAVTMLRDLDGDGVMDYYHDVVNDLPGARGPDYLHQNNGIALDEAGNLFLTTAFHTDAHPARNELEGSILKVFAEDESRVEVYATGMRNPFGLAFDAEGNLFATDNDAQTGRLGGNPGDKLLRVTEGAFFGHPYGDESDEGVSHHALRSKFSLGGLTLATAESLPEPYRDSLYVVVYGEGRIMRVVLDRRDDGLFDASLVPFATVPGAVDVAAAPDGTFYVAVYPDKIVRIRRR